MEREGEARRVAGALMADAAKDEQDAQLKLAGGDFAGAAAAFGKAKGSYESVLAELGAKERAEVEELLKRVRQVKD
jgi:hypothetical protein